MIRAGSDFLISVAWQFLPGMVSNRKNRTVTSVAYPSPKSFQREAVIAYKIQLVAQPVFDYRKMPSTHSPSNNLVAKFS